MARIEGVYQRFLKTIPKEKITTLSPQKSQEIDIAFSEMFSKNAAIASQRQRRAWYLMEEHYYTILERVKGCEFKI